jgi:hypothetical protein
MQKEKRSHKPSPSAAEGKAKKEGGKAVWYILAPLLIVGTGGLAYLGWKALTRHPLEPEGDYTPSQPDTPPALPAYQPGAPAPAPSAPASPFPLRLNSRGDRVKVIQQALNTRYKAGLDVDGIWGPKTEAALKKHGLPTTVTEQQYTLLKSWIEKGGLSGLPAQVATVRPATVWSARMGQAVPLGAGTLLGAWAGDAGAGFIHVLAPSGDLLTVRGSDTLTA